MDDRLDLALDGIEADCAAIAAAIGADDLEAAGRCNQELDAKLVKLAALLDEAVMFDEAAMSGHGNSLESVAARLSRVLNRYAEITDRLASERDRAADEIRALKSGRRAATHYLDTAGSTAS